MRRSFRTRESEARHTQGVALGWYAVSLWDVGNLLLMPPPPPGMEIQDFTLRWYAVSPWDISSLQRSHEHQMIRPSC